MTRRAAGYLVAVSVAHAVLAEPATAARLPEWAEAIARTAPEVEVGVAEDEWRVLLYETATEVRADGTLRIRRRVARQALRATVDDEMEGFLFHDRREMKRAKAWHRLPGRGKTKRSGRASVVDVATSAALTDSKLRMVRVDDVERGSLVFFEFEAEEKPLAYAFIDVVPTHQATTLGRIVYRLPAGWSLRSTWLNGSGPEPVVAGGDWTWELEGLTAIEGEALSEPAFVRFPRLLVALQPPLGRPLPGVALPDWGAFSAWYERLAGDRFVAADAVTGAARDIVPADADFVVQVEAAAAWVRDSVRYVAIEIGIGALQPRPPAETLKNRYGDCKDKAALLSALLTGRGIATYPVLVHATAVKTVDDELPSIGSFDHMILGVAVPPGVTLPAHFASATLESGGPGRLLFVDVTDERTAIGSLPAGLAAHRALVVAGDGGRLVTLPGADPGSHRLELRAEVAVETGRTARYELTMRLTGEFAARARAALRDSADSRERYWRKLVANDWTGAEMHGYQLVAADQDGAFVERVSFELGLGASSRLPLFPSASRWVPKTSLRKREIPLVFGHARQIRLSARVVGVPVGATLKAPVARTIDGLEIAASMQHDADALTADATVTLAKTSFAPAEFRGLRKAYASLRSLGGFSVTLP